MSSDVQKSLNSTHAYVSYMHTAARLSRIVIAYILAHCFCHVDFYDRVFAVLVYIFQYS